MISFEINGNISSMQIVASSSFLLSCNIDIKRYSKLQHTQNGNINYLGFPHGHVKASLLNLSSSIKSVGYPFFSVQKNKKADPFDFWTGLREIWRRRKNYTSIISFSFFFVTSSTLTIHLSVIFCKLSMASWPKSSLRALSFTSFWISSF
jgi:hypothetical protein